MTRHSFCYGGRGRRLVLRSSRENMRRPLRKERPFVVCALVCFFTFFECEVSSRDLMERMPAADVSCGDALPDLESLGVLLLLFEPRIEDRELSLRDAIRF